jgi:hypothetical protein
VVLNKSLIWDHGTDYVDVENANHYAWRRLYCFKNYLVSMKQDATSNTRRHLRVTHDINLDSVRKRSREVFKPRKMCLLTFLQPGASENSND